MRHNPFVVVVALLGAGALASLPVVRESTGVGADDSWQLALVHAELALAPLLLLPRVGGRKTALSNFAMALACWAAASACVLLFAFSSVSDAGWQTRGLSAVAWLFASGWLALAARGGRDWTCRARVGVLGVFGLPVLWHYFVLEYGGASALHLRPLSPNWALASEDVVLWPLLLGGAVAWLAAFALPGRDE